MNKLRISAILMIIAILGITGFQLYWLKNNYQREQQNLEIKTREVFGQTVESLQKSKLKIDSINLRFDSVSPPRMTATAVRGYGKQPGKPASTSRRSISVLNLVQDRMRDSLTRASSGNTAYVLSIKNDTARVFIDDSTHQKRIKFRTVGASSKPDSLLLDPDMVREVHVFKNRPFVKKSLPIELRKTIRAKSEDGAVQERVLLEKPFYAPGGDMGFFNGPIEGNFPEREGIIRFLFEIDSIAQKDSITVREIAESYRERLRKERINVSFSVARLDSTQTGSDNAVTIGFSRPATFDLSLHSTFNYMLGRLKLPILFSLLLVGITLSSFVLLYRNMMKQKRLADLKNDFISNITHELKTPIATVGVAIEALKSFNAINDQRRTEEYLDISQNELQRLNLLVDKVLKLSMFEKKEIELKYETFDLREVVDEVVSSMRLQIEKYGASVLINTEGDCYLNADRLHLLSVVYNLLDNALKYGSENQTVRFNLEEKESDVVMIVSDNGIGIEHAYKDKVFDKFFRIPQGNTHNAGGYGLGLSYVAHVVKKHKGTIVVESQPGKGTAFTITLPKTPISR